MVDLDWTIAERLEHLSKLVMEGETDAKKFDRGMIYPGIRVRKLLQKVKKEAQDIRNQIQEIRMIRERIKIAAGLKKGRKEKKEVKTIKRRSR